MSALLATSGLGKTYQKGNILIPALSDVSFHVTERKYISIVGKSGSGKSTLLNLVGGLDKPSSGKILFNGKDLSVMTRFDLALHRRFSVGMVFQSFNLIPSRTALENVILPLTFSGVPRNKRAERARDLLKKVGLEHRTGHLPSELSGGEAQRVAIARALANNPRLILADEPTGNLDSSTSKEIVDLLVELNKKAGMTILMVTHDRETAEEISDDIIALKDGKIT